MIFVTVGTHEQQFDRLIKYIDKLVENGEITEEVIIQTGFSNYKPKRCKFSRLMPYNEMINNIKEARIIITHGGPATFVMPLHIGKIPIVVPRLKRFNEHINDHQLEFAKLVKERNKNIIVIEEIDTLSDVLKSYDKFIELMPRGIKSNNEKFNKDFDRIIKEII